MNRILCLAIASIPTFAAAVPVTCFTDDATRKQFCIEPGGVRQNGDLRAATLFTGGPKSILKTPYTMVVDCKKDLATLQDASGVNFSGSPKADSPAYTQGLMSEMCDTKKTKPDKSIKQFGK